MQKITWVLFFSFLTQLGFSQTKNSPLKFDTPYYDAVNTWVALPAKKTDTVHYYGFIYLDQHAGFTFEMGNTFKITENNEFIAQKPEETNSMKYRIQSNWTNVAIIPEKKLSEMNLPAQPKWLKVYTQNANKVSYLKDIGYFYNHVGASHQALKPLLKAYKKEPHYKGLEFELAFAYNALNKFDEAVPVLEKAIKHQPKDAFFHRELGFAFIHTNQLEKAEKAYRKGIEVSKRNDIKAEMAINMTQSYFKIRNRKKFDEWAKITRKYAPDNSQFSQYIDMFEKEWDKK